MRPSRALVVLVTGLAAGVIVRSTVVDHRWHFVYNLGLGAFAVGLATSAGLRAGELGWTRRRLGSGLRLGALAFVAISAAEVVGALAGVFDDHAADLVDVTASGMLFHVLVTIPIGTVVVEELIFRSSLDGLLTTSGSVRRTMAAGAVLFGLWHVPAIAGDDGIVTVVGTFAATTTAGAVFIWLRHRSDSIAAPMLAHLATNSTAYTIAWIVSR